MSNKPEATIEDLTKEITAIKNYVMDKATEGKDKTMDYVNEHPLKVSGISLAVGFLAGYLLSRR